MCTSIISLNVLRGVVNEYSQEVSNSMISDAPKYRNWSYVYFQHLRKTGGTSIVEGLFHRNNLCAPKGCIIWGVYKGTGKNILEHKQKCDEDGIRVIVIEWYAFDVSHYSLHKNEKMWKDVLLVTILRDPIQRTWSDMKSGATFHCGKNISLDSYKHQLENETFLMECAEDYHQLYTSNVYVKIFSGNWMYAESGNDNRKNIDVVNRTHLKVAKDIIADFDVILLLEMWQETSVQLLCNKIKEIELDRFNVGESRPRLNDFPKLKNLLHDLNTLDIEFYNFAKDLALKKSEQCQDYRYAQFAQG